jgi:pyrimidine operon attenuation protein/uracil phosphoribosyltransferase
VTAITVMQSADVARAITRIAHEILESNRGSDNLVLLGIPTRGVTLAARIASAIFDIDGATIPLGSLDVTMYRDDLHANPLREPAPTAVPVNIEQATVVLVDDVLYSGRTVRAALDALSDFGRPDVVRLAVLIDRGHRELPIRADYVGKNLPSSPGERINVCFVETDGIDAVDIDRGGDE